MAVLAGALGWWLLSGDDRTPRNISAAQVAQASQPKPEITPVADPRADEAQVRRAYEQFQVTYADLGVDGLEEFSKGCAQALSRDPRIIDYCLAFDAFSGAVASGSPWFGDADARHVELARAALPQGVDAATRVTEVRRLTRAATGAPEPVQVAEAPVAAAPPLSATSASGSPPAAPVPAAEKPAAPPPTVDRASVRKAATPPARIQRTSAPPKAKPVRKAVNRCRFESTPAARALCADPELRAADRRLKQAYDRALAAGVDPLELDRQQAEWRTAQNANAAGRDAMARAYEVRIGQLESFGKSPE